jgi:hypothetical protein
MRIAGTKDQDKLVEIIELLSHPGLWRFSHPEFNRNRLHPFADSSGGYERHSSRQSARGGYHGANKRNPKSSSTD